ncbi:MAG: isopentenyl phosphate kinase [Anaerolineae bacterium]
MALVFLKLGGSLITNKRGEAALRPDVLAAVAAEIHEALSAEPALRLVLGHGSGSFGHVAAQRWRMLDGPPRWQAYAEVGAAAARLNRHVADALLAADVPAVTLQPSASAVAENGRLVELALAPLQRLLGAGVAPLVYGDVAVDTARSYCIISTETIFSYLAARLAPTRIILAGQVDGVYSHDPLHDASARPLPRLTPSGWDDVAHTLHGAAGVDVTGGMASKVRAMLDIVRAQPTVTVHLLSGLRANAIRDALLGQDTGGTLITADD